MKNAHVEMSLPMISSLRPAFSSVFFFFSCIWRLACKQVRMALGPDGNGFKQGHRASQSLYEKAATAPSSTDTTVVSEEEKEKEKEKEKVIATEVAVDAEETVNQEEQHPGES